MKSRLRAAGLLAATCVALAAPAAQAATGSASLSNLHIQLIGLFGNTPTLSLDNGYTWVGANAIVNTVYQTGNYDGANAVGAGLAPVSFGVAGTSATASNVAGSLLGTAGWGGSASASASGAGLGSYAYSQTQVNFVLGANTLMVVTAASPTVSASASAGEYASASAYLSVYANDNSTSSYSSASWFISTNGQASNSLPGSLQASIVNLGSGTLAGQLYAQAYVSVEGVAAVPEPASVALLLAGLLSVGYVARRRQG